AGETRDAGGGRGEVRRIGIRSRRVRTLDGAEVVLPNSKLVSEAFVNWTLSDRERRIEIPVGVAYGSDPDHVIELLEAAVRARPEVLRYPPPTVVFERLGESSLDFMVRAWAPDLDGWGALRSALTRDILRALGDAGIEIPFPQRELRVRSVDPARRPAPADAPTAPPAGAAEPDGGEPGGACRASAPRLESDLVASAGPDARREKGGSDR